MFRPEIADDQIGMTVSVDVSHAQRNWKHHLAARGELRPLTECSIRASQRYEYRLPIGLTVVRIDDVGNAVAVDVRERAGQTNPGPAPVLETETIPPA